VEPSDPHSSIARALGLEVLSGYFSADRFEQGSFDLVLLSHVIEHIYEPVAFLEQCMSVLRPDGILCVITPNADSLLAELSGRYWVMLKPVDHVTLFASRTFRDPRIARLGLYKLAQSEFAWEPLVSLGAALRDRARSSGSAVRREQAGPQGPSDTAQGPSKITWQDQLSLIRRVATGVGLPLHLAAVAMQREATLLASFRRR
jgi:SAM-dependent methyltransferase